MGRAADLQKTQVCATPFFTGFDAILGGVKASLDTRLKPLLVSIGGIIG